MFISGYLLKVLCGNKNIDYFFNITNRKVNNFAFTIQNYCYSFFLIHGAVLVSLKEFFSLGPQYFIILSFVISSILSIIHKQFSDVILKSLQQ